MRLPHLLLIVAVGRPRQVHGINASIDWSLLGGPFQHVASGATKYHVFRGFDNSHQMCRLLYQPWWERFEPRRRKADLAKIVGPQVARRLPRVPKYQPSPVQSMGATLGSRQVIFHGSRTQFCKTACEEERSFIELYINQMIDRRHVVKRFKHPFAMKCADGYFARLEHFPDDREMHSEEMLKLEVLLQGHDPSFRRMNFPEFDQGRTPRNVGSPVARCMCRTEAEISMLAHDLRAFANDRAAGEETVGASDQLEDDEQRMVRSMLMDSPEINRGEMNCWDLSIDRKSFEQPKKLQRSMSRNERDGSDRWNTQGIGTDFADNPYAEGATDLENAYNLWMEIFPDSPPLRND